MAANWRSQHHIRSTTRTAAVELRHAATRGTTLPHPDAPRTGTQPVRADGALHACSARTGTTTSARTWNSANTHDRDLYRRLQRLPADTRLQSAEVTAAYQHSAARNGARAAAGDALSAKSRQIWDEQARTAGYCDMAKMTSLGRARICTVLDRASV